MDEINNIPQQVPWFESNLLWGPVALGAAILLALVVAMKHELRWLLGFVALCFIFVLWALVRRRLKAWLLVVVVSIGGLLICGGIYWMYRWLGQPEAGRQNERTDTVAQSPTAQQTPMPQSTDAMKKTTSHTVRATATPVNQKPAPAPSSISQECAPGASCAMSSGQQGGITAGTINYGSQPRTISDEKVTAVADALSLNRGTITIRTINQTGDTLDYAFRWNTVFADAHWSVGRSADTRTEDVGDNGLIPFPKGLHVYFDTNSKLAEFVRKTIKESGIDCSPAEHKNHLGTNLELLVGNQ